MKTKRLVQRTLAFLCFTIASCSKNKPCVGSKTRKESTKQVSIKVLTAEINPSTASSTNPSTTTSSQGLTAEVTKLSDNLSSSISTPNTSSSDPPSSVIKAVLDTITKYLPAGHGVIPNNPVALLNDVLSKNRGSVSYDFDKSLSILISKYAEAVSDNKADRELFLDKTYIYKRLVRPGHSLHYGRVGFLQLAIIASKAEVGYEMKDTCSPKKKTVHKLLKQKKITDELISYWRGMGVTLDEETINYWEAIAKGNNEIKKLINLEGLKTLKKNAN